MKIQGLHNDPIKHGIATGLCAVTILAASLARADVVTGWNIKAGEIITQSGIGTPPANRAMAIVHTAIYEAANAITKRYPGSGINLEAPSGASMGAAVAAASLNISPK